MNKHPFIPEYPDQEPSYLVEPQPVPGIEDVSLCNDFKFGVFNKEISAWRIRTVDFPIKPNDEIYQQEEWAKGHNRGSDKPLYLLKRNVMKNNFNRSMSHILIWQPPSTMPEHLARKRWKVLEVNVELVEVIKDANT